MPLHVHQWLLENKLYVGYFSEVSKAECICSTKMRAATLQL